MAENSKEALGELLEILRRNDARAVADDIASVIARGVTEEIELKGKVKELSQRPLNPDEAYRLAIEMFLASLEPTIMKDYALKQIKIIMGVESSIEWRHDFVENSPISPERHEEASIPIVENVEELERALSKLVKLMDEE